MNEHEKINYVEFSTQNITETITREKSFVYSFLSSLRQKINKPMERKKP